MILREILHDLYQDLERLFKDPLTIFKYLWRKFEKIFIKIFKDPFEDFQRSLEEILSYLYQTL